MARFALVVLLLSSWNARAQSMAANSEKSPAFSLTIAADAGAVITGHPCFITIKFTNLTPDTIHGMADVYGADYRVEVRGSDGKLAADTKYGSIRNHNVDPRKLDETQIDPSSYLMNIIHFTLKPGESRTSELDAAKLYDMTKPGLYTIRVEQPDPTNPGTVVKSNVITVTVTP
jgi:hypothetical protein